jgi:hypothetical protein
VWPKLVQTLVYHVSEKTAPEFTVHMPSVSAVYQKILSAVNGKVTPENVVLLPEYNAHANWEGEAAWLIANFQGIPVMVIVLAAGIQTNMSLLREFKL